MQRLKKALAEGIRFLEAKTWDGSKENWGVGDVFAVHKETALTDNHGHDFGVSSGDKLEMLSFPVSTWPRVEFKTSKGKTGFMRADQVKDQIKDNTLKKE